MFSLVAVSIVHIDDWYIDRRSLFEGRVMS